MSPFRHIYRVTATFILLLGIHHLASAQQYSVSTNLLSWANLGTINAEGSVTFGRHVSIHAGATANPWSITSPTNIDIRNRQYGGYIGARYWPWHVYSEWWVGGKLQFKSFDQAGLFTSYTTKGFAAGAGINAGYNIILSSHLNLDVGLGLWAGARKFREQKATPFLFLDNVIVAMVYIF